MRKLKLNGKRGFGKVALVDPEDYIKVKNYSWTLDSNHRKGAREHLRVKSCIKGKHWKLHRFILGITDPKLTVDHINGNTLDNRRSNLQVLSFSDHARKTHADRKKAK